jgi:hypothetical protein
VLARDLPSPRQRVASLDGSWSFWPDVTGRLPTGPGAPFVAVDEREQALGSARTAIVPSPWQALFEDLRVWAGSAWYEKRFDVDEVWRDRVVRLCFGAIDYFCSVWVNGREVGEHEGGYLPFALDVTDFVRPGGSNTVTVRVLDVGPGQVVGPFPFAEIPHGKQSWYGPIGGIWQSAWVEARGADLIEGAVVHADPASGTLRVRFRGTEALRYRVVDIDGREVTRGKAEGPSFETAVAEPTPWHPDRPAFYELELESSDDRWSTTFGFRVVGTDDGIVTVNGEPVYLLGALDQDYWPGSIATPPSDEALDREMRLTRELGLNLLRCHIKPPTPAYLDAADRAGILVWCEPPSWISLTADAGRRARDTISGMVERDANHPSLVAWSIVNEGWGVDLTGNAEDRAWLADTFDWAKALDPTRLWVDNSACPPTVHAGSDLNDFHLYRAVPEQLPSWRRWTTGWARDAGRTYRATDGARVGVEPRILSEFGIWGLPDVDDLVDESGNDPWWFDTGGDTADAIVRPKGVRGRFDEWGLAEIFGSWHAFVRESQKHQFEGLRAEIEELRLHPEIAGYVITELSDVHWEANGILTLRRDRKAFHDRFEEMNAQTVVIGRPEHTRYRSGERAVIHVAVVSPLPLPDTRVGWTIADLGLDGTIAPPGPITFDVPTIDSPIAVTVSLDLVVADASRTVRSSTILWLFPDEAANRSSDVVIASRWDAVADRVAEGGRAVVIATDDEALPDEGGVRLDRWDEDDDATGWFRSAGLGWLHPRVTDGLALGPRVDLAFLGITPQHRLRGYGPERRSDVLAGHHLGWIRDVTASIAGFRHGDGAGIVCTFPLLEVHGRDPVATALLDRLVALAGDGSFSPETEL